MEQIKSGRLEQFTDLIKDMVSYADIYCYLLEDDSITFDLHSANLNRLKQEPNTFVMGDILEILKKRKGGFDRFVEVLRRTDYIWLAEQLDPNCEYSESQKKRNSSTSFVSSVTRKSLSTFARRKSRTIKTNSVSDDLTETVYTTYRDSFTSDNSGGSSSRRTSNVQGTDAAIVPLTNSSDTILPDLDENLTKMSLDDMDEDGKTNNRNSVLLYNIPEANSKIMDRIIDTKQFERVAKMLGLPNKILNGLKVIRVGRISKGKCKGSGTKDSHCHTSRPLKARFRTEKGCKQFLQSIQHQGGVVKTEFGDIVVEPCENSTHLAPKRKHWYQKNFFHKTSKE